MEVEHHRIPHLELMLDLTQHHKPTATSVVSKVMCDDVTAELNEYKAAADNRYWKDSLILQRPQQFACLTLLG